MHRNDRYEVHRNIIIYYYENITCSISVLNKTIDISRTGLTRIINDSIETCYSKIKNLIYAEINNGSKDYDANYIRNHIEKLTS